MSASSRTVWGYYVSASGGTGAVTVVTGIKATQAPIAVMTICVTGSATTDYAVISDGTGNLLCNIPALTGNSSIILGGARMDGLSVQCYGGTNGAVAIFVP